MFKKDELKKGWVVYNEKGYDELTTTSNNFFIEIKNGKINAKEKLLTQIIRIQN